MATLAELDAPGVIAGRTILLVEDIPDIRDLFATLLGMDGAEVVTTGSGREAIEFAMQRDFDILLTDIGLPDIPGDVLIRTVLAICRRRPHVVVVTGFGEPQLSRARKAGADVILTKPVSWNSLIEHLRLARPEQVSA